MPNPLDATDRRILALLVRDPRAGAAQISRALDGVTERAVSYRLKRLLRDGVVQVSAVVEPRALGFTVLAEVYIDVAPGEVERVAHRLVGNASVPYVAASIGRDDLRIQVCARDRQELERIVAEEVASLPGVLDARTALVPWKLKDVYEWQIPDEQA
jgi:Lrp/AsnC family transcriptional regulator, regulator for asnA, asnC and gidA